MRILSTLVLVFAIAFCSGQETTTLAYPGCYSASGVNTKGISAKQKESIDKCTLNSIRNGLSSILEAYDLDKHYSTANKAVLVANLRINLNAQGEIISGRAISKNKHFQRAMVNAIYQLGDNLKSENRNFTLDSKSGDVGATAVTLRYAFKNTKESVAQN